MIKKMFFLAFICVLAGCQKDAVQFNSNEFVSSDKLTDRSDYGDFPLEINDIIANLGDGHLGCKISDNKQLKNGEGSLGTYAYPLASDMNPLFLPNSSLPCQPDIPYFIFSRINRQNGMFLSNNYSATFFLVLNPSYNSEVDVVDIDWGLNGQDNPAPIRRFTVNNLQIGESNSVACKVFSTDDEESVYLQEMKFDFQISLDLGAGFAIEYGSGYSYACTNTGLSPIIAP